MFRIKWNVLLVFAIVLAQLVNAQPRATKILHYYDADSILVLMPEYRTKNDSLDNYKIWADFTLRQMKIEYRARKREDDSLRKSCKHEGYCHHLPDSVANWTAYQDLAAEECRIIDSILNQAILDTIMHYGELTAKRYKYSEIYEGKIAAEIYKKNSDQYVLKDVTARVVEEMRRRGKIPKQN